MPASSSAGSTAAAPAAASADGPLRQPLPGDPGTLLAFSDRAVGNVSRAVGPQDGVDGARAELAAAVELEGDDLVLMEQVHGAGLAVVGLADRGRGARAGSAPIPGADALVTTDPDVGLVVLVADCVPVLLAVPRRGVAAVHAGRAGVASGIVGAAVAVLAAETGASVGDVVAVIGPAVGGCCYEVPRELQVEVAARVRAAAATTSWGTPSLDLPAAVAEQLRAGGVTEVQSVGGCTVCDSDRWFSHRATTNDAAPAGRQAGVVRMGARPPRSGDDPSLDSA